MAGDSTYNGGKWKSENGILVPVNDAPPQTLGVSKSKPQAQKVLPKPVKKVQFETKAVGVWAPGEKSAVPVAEESVVLPVDSLLADSLEHVEKKMGMVLDRPVTPSARPKNANTLHSGGEGMSWVFLVLGLVFCVVALKFKSNTKYLKVLVSDLTEVRLRHNAFDDTVRETSFLILLNVLWVCCTGVLLWKFLLVSLPSGIENSISVPDKPGLGIAACTGVVAVYAVVMAIAYSMVGNVFSDRGKMKLWVKGWAASQGLEVILFFPIALLTLCYSPWTIYLLEIAAGVFILGKIIFIYKGFRIFFNQISSWLLFLYYLCSLEIVPLILTYVAALELCLKVL